jgi:hypothetical protein
MAKKHCCDYIQLIDPLVFLFIFAHAITVLFYLIGFIKINGVKDSISTMALNLCSDDENNRNISDLNDAIQGSTVTIVLPLILSILHLITIMSTDIYLWKGIVERRRKAF